MLKKLMLGLQVTALTFHISPYGLVSPFGQFVDAGMQRSMKQPRSTPLLPGIRQEYFARDSPFLPVYAKQAATLQRHQRMCI